jgi:hypothetical protein
MAKDVFMGVYPPSLIFAKKQDWMNVIQCCIMIGWTYLTFVVPSIFLLQPGMVSDKNTQRNIFTIITLCSFHKGSAAER